MTEKTMDLFCTLILQEKAVKSKKNNDQLPIFNCYMYWVRNFHDIS